MNTVCIVDGCDIVRGEGLSLERVAEDAVRRVVCGEPGAHAVTMLSRVHGPMRARVRVSLAAHGVVVCVADEAEPDDVLTCAP